MGMNRTPPVNNPSIFEHPLTTPSDHEILTQYDSQFFNRLLSTMRIAGNFITKNPLNMVIFASIAGTTCADGVSA